MTNKAAELEAVCTLTLISHAEGEIIGPSAYGTRVHGFIESGDVSGPKLSGIVRPIGGGDWAIARTDGVIDIDARLTIEASDKSLIYVAYSGVIDLPPGGMEAIARGEFTAAVKPKIALRMTTPSPLYSWVNRKQFVGFGTATLGPPTQVRYEIYHL